MFASKAQFFLGVTERNPDFIFFAEGWDAEALFSSLFAASTPTAGVSLSASRDFDRIRAGTKAPKVSQFWLAEGILHRL